MFNLHNNHSHDYSQHLMQLRLLEWADGPSYQLAPLEGMGTHCERINQADTETKQDIIRGPLSLLEKGKKEKEPSSWRLPSLPVINSWLLQYSHHTRQIGPTVSKH